MAQALQEALRSAVLVSDWLERMANPVAREAGIDLAHVLLKAERVEKVNMLSKANNLIIMLSMLHSQAISHGVEKKGYETKLKK